MTASNVPTFFIKIPDGEERGAENIFENIIAANFLNQGKETDIQVQEAQRVPNKMCTKRPTPRCIMIRMAYVINRQS